MTINIDPFVCNHVPEVYEFVSLSGRTTIHFGSGFANFILSSALVIINTAYVWISVYRWRPQEFILCVF